MAIPAEETKRYYDFIHELKRELGTVAIPPDSVLWHYTSGQALIEIVRGGSIYAIQLSGLNDTTELRYGAKLFREALASLLEKYRENATSLRFIEGALDYFKESTDFPAQPVVPHLVNLLQ